jgi:uncharacterized protein (DUF58 family)
VATGEGYRSNFRGRGMEFSEVRPYQPGDDIRHLDWRVTARTGVAHTKLFHEERERPVFISLDLRQAMMFATQGQYKAVLGARIASLLAWRAAELNDRVGGMVISEEAHHELKPLRGKRGVLNLLHSIAEHAAWQPDLSSGSKKAETDTLSHAISRLQRITTPGSLIVMLSDFRDLSTPAEQQLMHLARHNQLVLMNLYDPIERTLPASGLYRFRHADVDVSIDTADTTQVHNYEQRFATRHQQLHRLATSSGIRCVDCVTTDDPVTLAQTLITRSTR